MIGPQHGRRSRKNAGPSDERKFSVTHCDPRAPGPWKETGKRIGSKMAGAVEGGVEEIRAAFEGTLWGPKIAVASTTAGACRGGVEEKRPAGCPPAPTRGPPTPPPVPQ